MIASKPNLVTKPQLMASLNRQTFKEIEVFEPLNDDTLKLIKSLRKDDKATVLILRSR
jgi:hypothetical protein